MDNYEEIIRSENAELHTFVSANITTIPDFSESFRVAERWTNLNATTTTWANLYRELINVGDFIDVLTVMNGRGKTTKISVERINEFLQKFPTLFWITLLQPGPTDSGTLRLLMKANRFDVIAKGKELLVEENKQPKSYQPTVWPQELSLTFLAEINTEEQLEMLKNHYRVIIVDRFLAKWTTSKLFVELAKTKPNWGVIYLLIDSLEGSKRDENAEESGRLPTPAQWITLVKYSKTPWPNHVIESLATYFESLDPRTEQHRINEFFEVLLDKSYASAIPILEEQVKYDKNLKLHFSTIEVAKALHLSEEERVKVIRENYKRLNIDALEYLLMDVSSYYALPLVEEIVIYDVPIATLRVLLKKVVEFESVPFFVFQRLLLGIGDADKLPSNLTGRVDLLAELNPRVINAGTLEDVYGFIDHADMRKLLKLRILDLEMNRRHITSLFEEAVRRGDKETAMVASDTLLVDPSALTDYMTTLPKNTKAYKHLATNLTLTSNKL